MNQWPELTPHEFLDARWKQSQDGCWVWTGPVLNHGYGHFSMKCCGTKWTTGAHRASYILAKGDIPDGLFVCHACDNPLCVNPDHLFLGTPRDNTHDCIQKGRFRRAIGDRNRHAKLTEANVLEILRLHSEGLNSIQIAEKFNVNDQSVRNIVRGKTWKHVKRCA